MNDVPTTTARNITGGKIEQLVAQVLTPERKLSLAATLPGHVNPERFERNLFTAMTTVRDIDRCTPEDIFNEVIKLGALGLYLDAQLGEAYLIVGKGYKIQARVGYRGLQKLARQSGEIKALYAHEVYANEHANGLFQVRLGDDKSLKHEPMVVGERGEWIGAYAVVKYTNGEVDFEWMPKADIFRIRDRSDAYKAFKDGKIQSTPWDTDEIEMGKKTLIRRLAKRLPASPELSAALSLEDSAEGYLAADADMDQRPRLADRFKTPKNSTGFGANTRQLESNSSVTLETGSKEPATSDRSEPSSTTSSSSPQVGGDADGEATTPDRLPVEVFEAYSAALARMATEESATKADVVFWKEHPGKIGDADNLVLNGIFAIHVKRTKSELSAAEAIEAAGKMIAGLPQAQL